MHWTDGYVAAQCSRPLLRDLHGLLLDHAELGVEPRRLFTNWQELLGFEIGWAKPKVAAQLCGRYRVKPDECEIIMMRASGLTECHLHANGASTFFVLGRSTADHDQRGGTLIADYIKGKDDYLLEPVRHAVGGFFEGPPRQNHPIFPGPPGPLAPVRLFPPPTHRSP